MIRPKFFLSLPSVLLALAIASTPAIFAESETSAAKPVVDFSEPSDAEAWDVVNDGVMGGLSRGEMNVTDGALDFSGTLSLENNGGFSLVETSGGTRNFEGATGVRLRVKGDGRTYTFRLGTDARHRGDRVSYSADFETEKGEWVERVIPFADLKPIHHGESVDAPPINLANIEQIGILIGDKNAGPFEIQIDWIALD